MIKFLFDQKIFRLNKINLEALNILKNINLLFCTNMKIIILVVLFVAIFKCDLISPPVWP